MNPIPERTVPVPDSKRTSTLPASDDSATSSPEFWNAARAEWRRLTESRRNPAKPGETDWRFVSNWCDELAREGSNLPRLCADMGLGHMVTLARGNIAWWPFDWTREPTMRERLEMDLARPRRRPPAGEDWVDDSPMARGLVRGEWSAEALARLDDAEEEHMAREAVRLADRRASPVHCMSYGDLRNLVLLDTWDLEWTTSGGGAYGHGIVSLGAWRWKCRNGKAMARIARGCGKQAFPHGS